MRTTVSHRRDFLKRSLATGCGIMAVGIAPRLAAEEVHLKDEKFEFLRKILAAPSPSGSEVPAQRIVKEYAKTFADEVRTDVHGNVIAVKNPGAPVRLMMAGHVDQVGLMVQFIDGSGFLRVQPSGGWDTQVLLGQRVIIWAKKGPVLGCIARRPPHVLGGDKGRVPAMEELWVDIGAADKKEADAKVRVGDPITPELIQKELGNGRIISPGLDDKVGVWTVFEALRRVDAKKLGCAFYAVATVQEELGVRGATTSAFGIDPHVGLAVDVTHATDYPTMSKNCYGDVSLGKGPVITRGPNCNPKVVELLIQAADETKTPYQLMACSKLTGTDARQIQITRAGVAAGLVSIPNRYMHGPTEMVSLDDLSDAATLLSRFAMSVSSKVDFRPA